MGLPWCPPGRAGSLEQPQGAGLEPPLLPASSQESLPGTGRLNGGRAAFVPVPAWALTLRETRTEESELLLKSARPAVAARLGGPCMQMSRPGPLPRVLSSVPWALPTQACLLGLREQTARPTPPRWGSSPGKGASGTPSLPSRMPLGPLCPTCVQPHLHSRCPLWERPHLCSPVSQTMPSPQDTFLGAGVVITQALTEGPSR